jgi:DNA-binding CsgD family transcriptional regulator
VAASAQLLAVGWAALAERRWETARECFERALAEHPAAAAYEGLSWAAWWLDDAETVFAARERAFALYRDVGDAAGAARMATWLASDQLDFHGAAAVAGGWLARAHRLLDPLEPGPDHGWLAFMDGYVAHGAGASEQAAEQARACARLGRAFAVPDLEMLGLALEGATLVARARTGEGMRRLDEAAATALEARATVPISGAWACCFLVGACVAVRDYERAFAWCDRIAEFAERHRSRYMLAFCRAEYGLVHLWRGRWAEAERMLESSIEDFSRARPAMVGGPLVALAELRRRQGRAAEAAALLDSAGSSGAAQLVRGRLALGDGDAGRAAELAERVLRRLPEHWSLGRVPAVELLAEARTACGELEAAGAAVAALRAVALDVGTRPLEAAAALAAGRLAARNGDHVAARPPLEDAVDGLDGCGAPFEAAEARTALAETLLALGRAAEAAEEAAGAAKRLASLGAVPAAERARRVLQAARSAAGTGGLGALTPRERAVLDLLAAGMTNREIADALVISPHTVHRHVSHILRKLDLPSRTAAAAVAIRASGR